MTTAVYRATQPPLSVPYTQNTAPVIEFNCLYTHDVRRKQKRWQDGFLRFHTFNKRVMLYDIPRNFIGDAHWKQSDPLQDGDEVRLEKDGVLIQVAECVGTTETDLTELRSSKNKRSGEDSSADSRQAHTPTASRPYGHAQRQGIQLKHRSLNALLGTPKGALGKASLPSRSPYDERSANIENEDWEDGQPPKRRRVEGATKSRDLPLWARTVDSTKQKRKENAMGSAGQQRPGTKTIINLVDDENESNGKQDAHPFRGFSSDVLASFSSPAKEDAPVKHQRMETPSARRHLSKRPDEAAVSEGPAQTKVLPDSLGATCQPERRSKSREECDVKDTTNEQKQLPAKRTVPERTSRTESQTLRIASRKSKKKGLLCQSQTLKPPSRKASAGTEDAGEVLSHIEPSNDIVQEPRMGAQERLLAERMGRLRSKATPLQHAPPSKARDIQSPQLAASGPQSHLKTVADVQHGGKEDSSSTLAELDQMIMPVAEPSVPPSPPAALAMPAKKDRHLRKVVSDVAQASPDKQAAKGASAHSAPLGPRNDGADMRSVVEESAPPRRRAKKALQRSVSLNTRADGTSAVILGKRFQTPKAPAAKTAVPEKAPDPWSREAFDLFAWRPPGWDEEQWCRVDAEK